MIYCFPQPENLLTYQGSVLENETSTHDILQSPFFPNSYPRDLTVEHQIKCNAYNSTECYIEITFSDFQISLYSFMEVNFCEKEKKQFNIPLNLKNNSSISQIL